MPTEIDQFTRRFKLLLHGTDIQLNLKQFGDRSPYRWEMFTTDRSAWLGTVSLSTADILGIKELGPTRELRFLQNVLRRSFGFRDEQIAGS